MTETAVKPRVRRTPAEIALAALHAANERYAKAERLRNRLKDELAKAQAELEAADRYARHAAQHPDLPQPSADDLAKAEYAQEASERDG